MKKNIKIILSYDGTHYSGWEKTPGEKSIEEVLQYALQKIFSQPFLLQVACKTEKNVHAKYQVVQFFLEQDIALDKLKRSLNGLLPEDIRVMDVTEENISFHPALDATAKKSTYFICNGNFLLPQHRNYCWHVLSPLNIKKMNRCIKHFLGENPSLSHIFSIQIQPVDSSRLFIEIISSDFLDKSLRSIVGALVSVGCNKISFDSLEKMIQKKLEENVIMIAPPKGLFLNKIYYAKQF